MGALSKLSCPHCGRTGTTSKAVPAGTKVRCPGCGSMFTYQPQPAPPASQASVNDFAPVPSEVILARPETPVQVVQVKVPEPRKGNGLAVAALVLGIIAVLICWIPFLGLLSLPVGALGFLLGAVAILIAVLGRRSGLATSIVGTCISVGAVIVSIAVTGAASKAVSESLKQQNRPAPVAKAIPSQPREAPVSPPLTADAQPAGTPAPTKTPAQPEWVTVPEPAQLGDVRVRVTEAAVAPVALHGPTGDGESQHPCLIVSIELVNTNQNKKVDYTTWAGENISLGRDYARLADNLGNTYKRIDFGIFDLPKGRTRAGSAYPGKPLTDVLVFEVPLETIEYLNLELPGKNIGTDGVFRFRIPAGFIRR